MAHQPDRAACARVARRMDQAVTRLVLSAVLVLTPAPLTAPKDDSTWVKPADATTVVESLPISYFDYSTLPVLEPMALSVETVSTAIVESPVATPPPVIPPTPMELVDQHFGWPGAQLVACESSWNRWAVGRYGERGLFQIHPVHRFGIVARLGYSWDDMFEVLPNILVAVEIRYTQGLRAWTCWRG